MGSKNITFKTNKCRKISDSIIRLFSKENIINIRQHRSRWNVVAKKSTQKSMNVSVGKKFLM